MKKVVTILIAVLSLFSLSGCILTGSDWVNNVKKPPGSIKIDGEEYVTGFYSDLFAVGVSYKENSTSLFTVVSYSWWHLEDSLFDIYYCQHEDALYWNPTLYCKKEQFEEIKAYYADAGNFDYYIGLYGEDAVKLPEDINRTEAEKAIAIIRKDDSYRRRFLSKVTYNINISDYERFIFNRESKDGLFTTAHESLIYYSQNIYLMDYEDGSKNVTHLYIPPNEVNEYLTGLLQEYNLINFN